MSYSSADRDWAEWIAWQLEDFGYTAILQAWDFEAGSNFIIEMDSAVRRAQRLIAVLSPEYLKSDFGRVEWAAVFRADPAGVTKKLVLVRVRACRVEGLLAGIVYIDLVDKDEASAKKELLARIGRKRTKPHRSPTFPGKQEAKFPGSDRAIDSGQIELQLVLTGTVTEEDRPLLEAILAHLRKFSGDASMTLIAVAKGSIVLTLRCSRAGFARLQRLYERGELSDVAGLAVQQLKLNDEKCADKSCSPAEAAAPATQSSLKQDKGSVPEPVDWARLVNQIKADQGLTTLHDLFGRGVRYFLSRGGIDAAELDGKVERVLEIVVDAVKRGALSKPERLMRLVRTIAVQQRDAHIKASIDTPSAGEQNVPADAKLNPEHERRSEIARRVLASLSERDREILRRFYLEEQTSEQICREMSLTQRQFRSSRQRAKARLGTLNRESVKSSGLLRLLSSWR